MNITSYKKITSELRKKYHFPKEIPKKKEDNAGWFGYGNQRLIEKYLYCNDNLIIEFGSYLGKSARFLCEKSSPYATVICVDSWADGGTSIQNGIKKKNNNNSKVHKNRLKHLYETFLVNMWEYKDKIIPIKMDGRKAAKMLSDMEVRPNFIYLDMDHTYDSVKGDLKALHDSFPNTLIVGDDIKYHKGVGKAVKEFIDEHKQYRLEIDENAFVLIPNIQKYEPSEYNYNIIFNKVGNNLDKKSEKMAIIIPNTKKFDLKKLDIFKKLNRGYKIFLVEQKDNIIGEMLNYGFMYAFNNGFKIVCFLKKIRNEISEEMLKFYSSFPYNPLLLEYLHESYFLQNFYLGNIIFNSIDFIRCNGYPNHKRGIDNSLFRRMAMNNIQINLPSSKNIVYNNKLNIDYNTFSKNKIKDNELYSWKENGLFSLNFSYNDIKKTKDINKLITQLYL